MQTAIRTRFAPSPTGYMHLGNIWVAFLNWLWTRQHGGAIVLRIEDIDRQRSHAEYIEGIKEDLAWMDLSYDEGPGGSYSYGTPVQSL
ncbi:MAG: glutamate--tRNA ligase family protein, partial [Dialister sp.]|nr:glutamate--tRNA ligase family protein [Dialister sp.]